MAALWAQHASNGLELFEPADDSRRRSDGANSALTARRSVCHAQAIVPAFRLSNGGYVALY